MKIDYFKQKIASLCYEEENVLQVQVAVDVPAGLKHTARLCRCVGGGLHLSTGGGAHVNNSMSTSVWQLCAPPSTETYSVTSISFLIKTICSYKPNFVHLGCSVSCENLHNAARLDARFSTLSLLWPEQSPHCWKTQCCSECWS